jgi:hypothetical protein
MMAHDFFRNMLIVSGAALIAYMFLTIITNRYRLRKSAVSSLCTVTGIAAIVTLIDYLLK